MTYVHHYIEPDGLMSTRIRCSSQTRSNATTCPNFPSWIRIPLAKIETLCSDVRRQTSEFDAEEVLDELEDAGIDREHAMSIDLGDLNEALEVTELSRSDVYEVAERKHVPKAEADEDVKESWLQGEKDRSVASDDEESEELRREIETLIDRIDDLTSLGTGVQVQDKQESR